ncbi:penicillin-binding transpeptidase domain-containing protein [Acidicapsa ligni]|uniref:penicillin-binding transpeptidase domain-containing protein n=1 Tax=Acidicapsa ligni TaxID=542300 RepID=UPI0021E0BEF2|nr:penicillin-binding transpeptidase domain-containing protein [Acidicapsa ligni]
MLLGVVLFFASLIQAHAQEVERALFRALQGTQGSAVVLDPRTGAVLASAGKQRRGSPGSAIKPLLLEYALEHGIVRPEMEVYCRRDLHVGGRALPCTHPADHPVFTAESALAESCNTWFAEMARRFSGPALEEAFHEFHLQHASMNLVNVEQRQLAVLGLDGVSVSPLEMGRAYRDLLSRMPRDGVIARGLRDSVSYGMADPAAVKGVDILGKTGTASDAGEAWTHGWFVGAIPGRYVLVVYVPHGDGGTAARLAQKFFRDITSEGQTR